MIDIILIAAVVLIIGAAVCYISKEKKKGTRCVGCPDTCTCPSRSDSCHQHSE